MRSIIIIVIALLIGILLTLVTLDVTGTANVFGGSQSNQDINVEDYEFVPLSRQDIPAFSTVRFEDVHDPAGNPNLRLIRKEDFAKLDPEPITYIDYVSAIDGKVLKSTKPANRYFSEEDFMPEGTSSGVAGAIPAGKRGITIRAEDIIGATSMEEGDRFDMLMTIPSQTRNIAGSQLLGQSSIEVALPGTTVVLVNNGYVVRPVTTRMEKVEARTGILGSEQKTNEIPIKEMSIAVDPDEAVAITSALAGGRQLVVAVRSGQVGAEAKDTDIQNPRFTVPTKPVARPTEPSMSSIEVIVGDKKSNYVY